MDQRVDNISEVIDALFLFCEPNLFVTLHGKPIIQLKSNAMTKVFTSFDHDNEARRDELIRTIEHSVERLTLGELESLYYDLVSKDSFFLRVNVFMPFTKRNTQKAMITKSRRVWMKLP